MRIQDVLSNLRIYLVTTIFILYKEKVLCCFIISKKARALALLTVILEYKTERLQDIFTNLELNLVTLFQ